MIMTSLRPSDAQHKLRHRQRGLSLVELMISMVIGLLLLIGVTTLIVSQSDSRAELEKTSRQVENGRYAMQILHDDIEHAGYYVQYYNIPAPPVTMPDPCLTTPLTGVGSLDEAMSLPIEGYNALPAPSASFSCNTYGLTSANYKPGTHILVVRRADTTSIAPPFTAPAPTPGEIYLQTNTSSHILALGQNTAAFTLTMNTRAYNGVTNISPYLVHVYFISPCSVPANGVACQVAANGTGPDDNGRPIPTLKRLELSYTTGGATTFTSPPVPLVEGIEDMQLYYGIDNNGDGYPDSYSNYPASTSDWGNVMNVNIFLMAQSTECSTGYTDTKTYSMGSAPIAASAISATIAPCPNGDYKRHVFNEVVRVVNPSSRRAQE